MSTAMHPSNAAGQERRTDTGSAASARRSELEAARAAVAEAAQRKDWPDVVMHSETVMRLAGAKAKVADHERLAQAHIEMGSWDDAHTTLLVATSQHPTSPAIRRLVLDTFRRQRASGSHLDLIQLARQYIRRFAARHSPAEDRLSPALYSALCLSRAGAVRAAGQLLASSFVTDAERLAGTQSSDLRILIDVALRQHQFPIVEALLDEGARRFADDPRMVVLRARYLNAVREPGHAARLLEQLFATRPDLATPGNQMHLVQALSSDDRVSEAWRVLDSIDGREGQAAVERLRLICKAIDTRFTLTHIDPVTLPDSDRDVCRQLHEIVRATAAWTSAPDRPSPLRAAGIERNIVTTLSIASRFEIAGRRLTPADTAEPLLDVAFGGSSWRSSRLGELLVEAIGSSTTRLDDLVDDFRAELGDAELVDRHPGLSAPALERLVLWHGGLQVAHLVNQHDWHRRVGRGLSSSVPSELHEAVAAACQLGERAHVDDMLDRLAADPSYSTGRFESLRGYVDLVAGSRARLVESFEPTSTSAERTLRDFLTGKSVAIVGPAPGEQLNGGEIDEFDVVIRPNRLTPPPPEQAPRHGSRTDIVSFAATRARHLRWMTDAEARRLGPDVRFTLFKYRSVPLDGGAAPLLVNRHLLRHVHLYALRQLNHLPQLVFYLNVFGVSRLKIFNADFFLSTNRWERDYVPTGRTGDLLTQLVFSDSLDVGHWFVRTLHGLGLVEADAQASAVLQLDTAEYMRAMSRSVVP